MQARANLAASRLAKLESQNLRRKLVNATPNGAYVTIGKKRLLNLSSNDYLGLEGPSSVKAEQSAASSRLLSGNTPSYDNLEKMIARHARKSASLVFPTGYMANIGVIGTLASKGDLIVSDERNHASIIDACSMSGAKVAVYKHNDESSLRSCLSQKGRQKFVITEGVFSMDGDVADTAMIAKEASKKGAITIIDDAHGDFVLEHKGRTSRADVLTSSLSKALGSFGGYVAADASTVKLCVNSARTLVYTSALPRFVLEHVLFRMRAPKAVQGKKLARNVKQLHKTLDSLGLGVEGIKTQIAPIVVGDEKDALHLGKLLYGYGVLAQAIRYPTVLRGQARVRISVTAWPTSEELGKGLESIGRACKRLGIA